MPKFEITYSLDPRIHKISYNGFEMKFHCDADNRLDAIRFARAFVTAYDASPQVLPSLTDRERNTIIDVLHRYFKTTRPGKPLDQRPGAVSKDPPNDPTPSKINASRSP